MYAVKINPPHSLEREGVVEVFFALPLKILGYTEEINMDKTIELAKKYFKEQALDFHITSTYTLGDSHLLLSLDMDYLYCCKVTYEEIEVI